MPFPWQKPLISVQSYGKGIYLPQLCVSFFANRGNVSPKLRYLHTNRPTLLSFCKPPVALACAFANPWHNAARFGITGKKAYLCLSKKRKGAGLSSFRVFGANYPIWAGKIIL